MTQRGIPWIVLGIIAFGVVAYLGLVHFTLRNIESMVGSLVHGAKATSIDAIPAIHGSAVMVGTDTVATLAGGMLARSVGEQRSALMLLAAHVRPDWEQRLATLGPHVVFVDSLDAPSAAAGVRLLPRPIDERGRARGVMLLRSSADSALIGVYTVY